MFKPGAAAQDNKAAWRLPDILCYFCNISQREQIGKVKQVLFTKTRTSRIFSNMVKPLAAHISGLSLLSLAKTSSFHIFLGLQPSGRNLASIKVALGVNGEPNAINILLDARSSF